MARLPADGEDAGLWGLVLNEFLKVSLEDDGTLKPVAIQNVLGLQAALSNKATKSEVDKKYTKPEKGIPISHLDAELQQALVTMAQSTPGSPVKFDQDGSPAASGAILARNRTDAILVNETDDVQAAALAADEPLPTVLKGKANGLAELDDATRLTVKQAPRSVHVGAHFPGFADSTGLNTTPASISTLEASLGFTADYVLLFQALSPGASYNATRWQEIEAFLAMGKQVVLNFELLGSLTQLNSGVFDAVIDQLGQQVVIYAANHAGWKDKLIIKFLHEGNLTVTYPWCVYAGANLSANNNSVALTAQEYVKAFQRVATRLRQASTSVTGECFIRTVWEIARDNNSGAQEQFDIFYPGDGFVDICSINNYNRFGVASGYAYFNSFGASFKPVYDQVRRIAPNKPVMVGETSSTAGGYINRISVANGGRNYPSSTTATITGNGINATADVQVSGGVIQSVTITNQGQDYSAATVQLNNTASGTGASLTADIRGAKFSKAQWFYDAFKYIRDNTDVVYLTFFFENKFVAVNDNRQWGPNTQLEKASWRAGYGLLNGRVKQKSDSLDELVIRKNLFLDPRTTSATGWETAGTNAGTVRISTNVDDIPENSLDSKGVLSVTHNGVGANASTNRVFFTIPYTQLAPNQNITISFDARAKNNNNLATSMYVQPGIEMKDSPNTFERNYPPFRLTGQYKRYTIVTNNGQYSPSGWRICWRIGTSTMSGQFQMTNIKVEYGEVASPLSLEAGLIDATASTKGVVRLAGDLSGTANAPIVRGKVDTVKFGLWHTNMSLPSAQSSIDQAKLFETNIGSSVDMIVRYAKVHSSSFASDVKPILDAGYTVQYFYEPTNASTEANLDIIINQLQAKAGEYYESFYFFFKDLAEDGRSENVILCMYHEANGDGFYPWQVFYGNNSPEKLKTAYQKTVELARSLGVKSKFSQIFLTKNSLNHFVSFSDMYAGDAYIDIVGVTDYNRLGISYASWRYPGMLLRSAYRELTAISNNPFMIAESNSVPSVGDYSRPQWFEQYKDLIMNDEFSRIAYYTLFSEDKTATGDPNWYISSDSDIKAVGQLVAGLSLRTTVKADRYARGINRNLLPNDVTKATTGWAAFGGDIAMTLTVSETVPDWFDVNERSIRITKAASSVPKPQDINFYYLPQDSSFWRPNKAFTLTFWAKSSLDATKLGVGVRENQGSFQIYADYSMTVGTTWNQYVLTFATDIPFAQGMRVPWFALGGNSGSLELFVAGIKLEYGHVPTSKVDTAAMIGLNNVDNTRDIDKPVSRATQDALNTKLSLDGVVSKPVNFKADKNGNILAIKNTFSEGHNIASMVFESETTTSREIQAGLFNDAIKRFSIETSGKLEWGRGGSSTRDTNLYRTAEKTLRTDGTFVTGKLRIFEGAGSQKILVSDGQGNAAWKDAYVSTTPIKTVTGNYSVDIKDYTIIAHSNGQDTTVTLPNATDVQGKLYNIKKGDATAGKVTVSAAVNQKIDNASTVVFTSQYQKITVQSDGLRWWVI